MDQDSLSSFTAATGSAWATSGPEIVELCRHAMALLMAAEPDEPWLAALHRDRPATRELYRHPIHGFMLLAHTENEGLYRPPHDHGRAWVVYGVQSGALEIGTYARVAAPNGTVSLVERDRSVLRAGEARAYYAGDIHDTRCLSDTALLFRFTERDLKVEDQVERKLTRFVERNGRWTAPGQ